MGTRDDNQAEPTGGRRGGGEGAPERPVIALRLGPLRLDPDRFSAYVAGRRVALTRLEFDMLSYLWHHPNRVITGPEFVERVIGGVHQPKGSLVRVHISNLRRKLGNAGSSIRTMRGRGFWFDTMFLIGLSVDAVIERTPDSSPA